MNYKDTAVKTAKVTTLTALVLGYGTYYVSKAFAKKVIKEGKESASFAKEVYTQCKQVIDNR